MIVDVSKAFSAEWYCSKCPASPIHKMLISSFGNRSCFETLKCPLPYFHCTWIIWFSHIQRIFFFRIFFFLQRFIHLNWWIAKMRQIKNKKSLWLNDPCLAGSVKPTTLWAGNNTPFQPFWIFFNLMSWRYSYSQRQMSWDLVWSHLRFVWQAVNMFQNYYWLVDLKASNIQEYWFRHSFAKYLYIFEYLKIFIRHIIYRYYNDRHFCFLQ